MRYVLAQINTTVGDLTGNAERIISALKTAEKYAPDLVIFPEMTLSGYPPEDLLLKPAFLTAAELAMQNLAAQIRGRALIGYPSHPFFAGHPRLLSPLPPRYPKRPRNSALLIDDGAVVAEYHKCLLPNYAVFDEMRYFAAGDYAAMIDWQVSTSSAIGRQKFGILICEDAWDLNGPANDCARAGTEVFGCLSASPFHRGKISERLAVFSQLCRKFSAYFLYCNLVGGQDDLIFDGASFAMNPRGEIIAQAASCAEDFLVVDLPESNFSDEKITSQKSSATSETRPLRQTVVKIASIPTEEKCRNNFPLSAAASTDSEDAEIATVYSALTLATRDYIRKNKFSGVIIGLSGGIDSALTAAIAVDAVGAENVFGVTMPSRYSSNATRGDAKILADNLQIRFASIPIESPFAALEKELAPHFVAADPRRDPENLTAQNLQARIRMTYLMALANKYGLLLLNTSNKSEGAVGYGTLYGDMTGGFAPLKDVFKTDVWKLSRHANIRAGREIIPVSTIDRVPSAELRENQEDRQSLPDYPLLDAILKLYIENDAAIAEIVSAGFEETLVRKIIAMVDRSEFKRRQSVFGPKVTPKAFGKDRRLPVTNRFAYEER